MLLVDADIIAYRIAWACEGEDELSYVLRSCDKFVSGVVINYVGLMSYQLYLTGKGNFRKEIAVTAPYKGNRTGEPPRHIQAIRQHMIDNWGAVVTEGEEADDAIAIAASKPDLNELHVMASVDKDFDQVPGIHYDFVNDIEYVIEPEEGLKLLYKQILTGDAIDNIIGVDGVGKAGADELIHGCRKETDMWDICVDQLGYDRALENARLVFLRRKPGQLWQPPEERSEEEVWYAKASSTTH